MAHVARPTRLAAALAAVAGLLLVIGTPVRASDPDAEISVVDGSGTHAGDGPLCDVHLEIGATPDGETGAWEIHDADGVVEDGEYTVTDTEGDRAPDEGAFDLDDGDYEVWWDDEEVDGSHDELAFTVDCDDEESPTDEPTASPTDEPTASPTDEPTDEPTHDATDTPRPQRPTPPSTDTVPLASPPADPALAPVLGILASITIIAGAAAHSLAGRPRR